MCYTYRQIDSGINL